MPYNLHQLDTFTAINLEDLFASFGWTVRSHYARLLRGLFLQPARTFARHMVAFDDAIGGRGLAEASRLLQRNYVKDVRVYGLDRLPAGPILALSNHPGMTDTVSLFLALNRPDLKIIALKRPFLEALTNMSRQLFFVLEEPAARMSLVRRVSAHLRGGGAILTFPAGRIEPDPNVYPGAVESLADWTDSVGVFVRMAPGTVVVPLVVRGVVWEKAARSPLLALKRGREEKERLASALQLLAMILFGIRPVTVTVQIGRPVDPSALGTRDVRAIHDAVLAEMRYLIENPPEGPGESAL
ncbi:MAG: 1-acyl-sn-glycerol-3-phosphate acyltransferase [Bacteroidota bacterium]